MRNLLIALVACAFAATAWAQGTTPAAPAAQTPAKAETKAKAKGNETRKVAAVTKKGAPKTISVKEMLKRNAGKAKRSGKRGGSGESTSGTESAPAK